MTTAKDRKNAALVLAAMAKLKHDRETQDTLAREIDFIQSLKIEDKVAGGLVDFRLWAFQSDFIQFLREHDRVFALKARQLGLRGRSSVISSTWG
jgi:hypothetical protein